MSWFESVKGTVNTAVDTIACVTQTIVEKNRTNAKLNRLRIVMKSESELMNRAYIALGKQYYEMHKKGETEPDDNQKRLFEVIEKSKIKIAKARDCYRSIIDSQNDIFYGTSVASEPAEYKSSDIVDITVACSNENEYKSSPFEANSETEIAEEKPETTVSEESKDDFTAEDITETAEDTESPDGELF